MIIFDLDGTLVDCEHRRHYVDASKNPEFPPVYRVNPDLSTYQDGYENPLTGKKFKPNWKAFYEACDEDKPIKPAIHLFHALHYSENEIQIWSGRCESTKEKTYQWLLDHAAIKYVTAFCPDKHLKMRPEGDYTPDDVLKEKWLDEALAEGNTIDFVVDDRPKVVRMWRRRGIFVFDVNQSGVEF